MAYTFGIGLRPEVALPRLAVVATAAAAGYFFPLWYPTVLLPDDDVAAWLLFAAVGLALPACYVPMVSSWFPVRVIPVAGGVAIPRRRVTFLSASTGVLLCAALALAIVSAHKYSPDPDSSKGFQIATAVLSAFAAWWPAQRPWHRRIELRPDSLTLRAGEASVRIPWEDIDEIDKPFIMSSARLESVRDYQEAAIRISRISDTRTKRKGRLEDRFQTGDLACDVRKLIPVLHRFTSSPSSRAILTDPDVTRDLLQDQPTSRRHRRKSEGPSPLLRRQGHTD